MITQRYGPAGVGERVLIGLLGVWVVVCLWLAFGVAARAADLPKSDLVEISAASSLGPDATARFSGGIGIRLGVLPDGWPLLGGHSVFASGLQVAEHTAMGGDFSLQRADEDSTRLRLGVCGWKDETWQWSVYLRWPVVGF